MKRFLLFMALCVFLLTDNSLSQTIVKRVLLEEFSTTPCGFCPEGDLIVGQLLEKYPNLITFTHHAGFGTDSMTIPGSITIANLFTTFAPAGVIDRGNYKIPVYTDSNYIGISRQKWDSVVSLRLNEPADADVRFIHDYDIVTRLLNVRIETTFVNQVDTNDYRFNFAIVEDSVSGIGYGWDQKNYFNDNPDYPSLYHKGDPYIGYIHNHVLRALPTGTWGVSGIPNYPQVETVYSYNLNGFKIPDGWKEKDIRLIAFVSYYNSNKFRHKVLNSFQSELLNTTGISDDVSINSNFLNISINPNPVNDVSTIEFTNPAENHVSVKIIDLSGNEALSINQSKLLDAGQVKIEFDTQQLSSGTYICNIKAGKFSATKKFVVVR
jgi:hypothetical protein